MKNFRIGGKFYGIIKNMYTNAHSCIKLPSGIIKSFPIERGIKQGDTLSPYLFNLYINDMSEVLNKCSDAPTLGNIIVGCLMYADDLIIISETSNGLQNMLDRLHSYCLKWRLQLNIKKTRTMIIRKRQSSKQVSVSFKFGNDIITSTDRYSYLGLLINSKGQFSEGIDCLKKKGYKALYHMTGSLYTGLTFSPEVPIKIFDSTVRPILTYGCEAWASEYFKMLLKPTQVDKAPFEQINNKFCKYILGVPSRASNFTVKAELGREPIFAYICSQVLRYWIRIQDMDMNRLVKQAYLSELDLYKAGKTSWAGFVFQILKTINFDNTKTVKSKTEARQIKCQIRTAYTDLYYDSNYASINHKSKLRTYVTFKNDNNMEKYLQVDNVPQSWRKLYCNFRISCHDLQIERGRYLKLAPELRICKICKLESETEQHFALFCPSYSHLRQNLFREIRKIHTNFLNLDHHERFKFLFNSQNVEIIKLTMEFISNAYTLRKEKLLNIA